MNIPGFEILEKVGEGGIAVIWKARQSSLDRIVAIKMLRPEFVADADEVRDFMREALTTAKVKHPNIIQIYDASEIDGQYCFVLEFVDGHTLADILQRDRRIHPGRTLRIARSVATALDCAWKQLKMVHRDLKPGNIMIDRDGTVKVADLGLAKRAADARGAALRQDEGGIEGTPNYISPEQASGAAVIDCRTDMYSLGATMYHMITGLMPFGDKRPMEALNLHESSQIPHPRDIDPSLPLGICRLIRRLMMKAPSNRYPDWSAVVAEIDKCIAGRFLLEKAPGMLDSTVALPTPKPDTAPLTRGRRRTSVPAWFRVPAWLALIAALAWLAFNQLDDHLQERIVTALQSYRSALTGEPAHGNEQD